MILPLEHYLLVAEAPSHRVLLAAPHPIVAYAVSRLLASIPALSLSGVVEHGSQVLSSFRKVRPQIVILDSELGGQDALELIRQLKKREPTVKILIYTLEKESSYFQEFLKFGAQGVVLKTQPPKRLLEALNSLVHRKIYIDPALHNLSLRTRDAQNTKFGLPNLSPRERQVLKLIAEGLKNKEISHTLSISVKTVETHRSNIMRKLDAHHIVDLLNWARRYELPSLSAHRERSPSHPD